MKIIALHDFEFVFRFIDVWDTWQFVIVILFMET